MQSVHALLSKERAVRSTGCSYGTGRKVNTIDMSTLATKNVAAVLATIALALGISFTFATSAKADAVSDLQAQVQALLAQIAALQGMSGSTGGSMSASCHTFTRDHKQGDNGGEVMWIQQFLNGHGAQIASSGAGSPGNESSYFGAKTKAAVMKYQAAKGITPTSGYWGPKTRAAANADCAGSMTSGTTGSTGGTVTPTGPGLTVSAGVQPANSLAPAGAQRVPFTSFTLTNNSSAPVTVTGITVQRTGIAQDQNFSGVVLIDSNGLQVGVSHTFDSNHQTVVGDTMTLAPGASQTFTVAGNISSTNAQSGEVAAISVVGINTSAPVAGSLPITGAQQTINTTLMLGNISIGSSAFDPGTPTTKHIGDTAVKFSGVRFTNSSTNEDAKFYSIRWRLNGSVGSSDLANVVTIVNGTSYPTTLSSDGRYYTTVFPGGILVGKGNNVDVYVQGDIVGTNASNRTAEFDIDKTSDVYFVGQVYGYGLSLTGTIGTYNTGSGHVTNADVSKQPWFVGSAVTVQGGTVTTIQNATNVPSQNIAVNVSNQPLGGFQTNFAGEPVTVQGMKFNITGIATTTTSQLTLISIVNENGSVVAGPVDAVAGVATFTNSVTFPTGLHTYTIQGKLPSNTANGGTIQLSTDPSTWTSPQGQLTGNSVTISTPLFTMNTMTVRSAQLTISAGTSPSSQTVVAGGQNVLMATIQLDASQSGEDVQLSSLPIVHTGAGNLGYLNNCQLWDGTTALNTGSDVLNTVATTSTVTFTQGALRITKGTVKTLSFTCNLSSSANAGATYTFGVNSSNAPTVTGVTSGNTVTTGSGNLVVNTSSSGTMTVSSGASVTVTIDSSSPSYAVNAGGTTGVVMSVIKLRATNENVNLTKLGLTVGNGSYLAKATGSGNQSYGSADLTQVYLYNSSGTLLGTATFTGTNNTATSTLNVPLTLTRDTDVTITVKADLANIGVSAPGGIGNLVKVDPLNFEGTGASSGSTIKGAASGTSAGVRLFKSYPSLALETLPSTGVADGRLMHFKVTANTAGSIGISKFTFKVSTTSATVTNIDLYGFTDSAYSQAVSGQGTGGQIGSQVASAINGTAFSYTPTNPLQIPAGQTYYFELRAAVSGVTTGSSVVTTLVGDSGFPTVNDVVNYNVATSSALSASNFIWSGNSTSTSVAADVDWSNGASLPGLPSSGIIQTRSN